MFTDSCSHEFISPKFGQSRAPCPALNALANHGYISHDGKNLTVPELVRALQQVYHLSFTLALVLSLAAVIFCGNGFRLDLGDLCKRNKIEHPGSLVHDDCLPGQQFASSVPSSKLLRCFLRYAPRGHGLNLDDFATARVDRESKLALPLDQLHSQIATGESALTWLVMKDQHDEVPKEIIKEWYGEERLPHGWVPPATAITLLSARGVAKMIAQRMK
ncbi:Chloroperoxidase [Collybia nuda]|uniref:Chloroperoxidase n=1 Tax=Collybia nuda TaxID=64659 RepID=A0A9P5XXH9_9AGAR|nr:Chloroperoxidase [Collybia nuda]